MLEYGSRKNQMRRVLSFGFDQQIPSHRTVDKRSIILLMLFLQSPYTLFTDGTVRTFRGKNDAMYRRKAMNYVVELHIYYIFN